MVRVQKSFRLWPVRTIGRISEKPDLESDNWDVSFFSRNVLENLLMKFCMIIWKCIMVKVEKSIRCREKLDVFQKKQM